MFERSNICAEIALLGRHILHALSRHHTIKCAGYIYRHAQQHILHYPDPNSGTEKRRFSDFVTYSPYLGRVPTLWAEE